MTRLRDTLCFPLLMILHLMFTVSSLVLRIYELLTTAPPESEYDEISTSRTRLHSSIRPPKHVGMVVLSPSGSGIGRSEGSDMDMNVGMKLRKFGLKERTKIVECVLNLVELASDEGIEEISVYERSGLLQASKPAILAELLHLPPSPPPSGPSSPPRNWSPDRSTSSILSESIYHSDQVTTISAFPSMNKASSQRRVTLHLIPPKMEHLMGQITREIRHEELSTDEITQELLNARIKERLHFSSDPELLIVHNLKQPSGWKAWLPRPAPELGGYPFWTLRLAEIYHHPPTLPLLTPFTPLFHLARTSTLPFLRKLSRLVPPPIEPSLENVYLYDGPGRIGREEWEGCMRAWTLVEQRMGR